MPSLPELKAKAKEMGLKGYSKMKKAELEALVAGNTGGAEEPAGDIVEESVIPNTDTQVREIMDTFPDTEKGITDFFVLYNAVLTIKHAFPSMGGYIAQFTKDYKVEIHTIVDKTYYVRVKTFDDEFRDYQERLNQILGLSGVSMSVRYGSRGVGTRHGAIASRNGGKSQKVLKQYERAVDIMKDARVMMEQRTIASMKSSRGEKVIDDIINKDEIELQRRLKALQDEEAEKVRREAEYQEDVRKAREKRLEGREQKGMGEEDTRTIDRKHERYIAKSRRLGEIQSVYAVEEAKIIEREYKREYIRIRRELPSALTNPELLDKLSSLLTAIPSLYNASGKSRKYDIVDRQEDALQRVKEVFTAIQRGANDRSDIIDEERRIIYSEREIKENIVYDEFR